MIAPLRGAWADVHEAIPPRARTTGAGGHLLSPVFHEDVLANEAFVIEDGVYRTLHDKQIFPSEEGRAGGRLVRAQASGVRDARDGRPERRRAALDRADVPARASPGRQGAHLIAVPRHPLRYDDGEKRAPWPRS